MELDRAEVRALWHHIHGLLPVFGSFKQSQIQLIVSSTGHPPARKSTLRNVMKRFLESRYRVLSPFLDLPARRSQELLAHARKHFIASFPGCPSHPLTCSLVPLRGAALPPTTPFSVISSVSIPKGNDKEYLEDNGNPWGAYKMEVGPVFVSEAAWSLCVLQ